MFAGGMTLQKLGDWLGKVYYKTVFKRLLALNRK
jgi:hypothetical protein